MSTLEIKGTENKETGKFVAVWNKVLPRMTMGNWLFWGILTFVGIHFLWLGILELYIPFWIGSLLAFVVFFSLVIYGPRELEDEHEGGE